MMVTLDLDDLVSRFMVLSRIFLMFLIETASLKWEAETDEHPE